MRLCPLGLEGEWKLYERRIEPGAEIDKASAPEIIVRGGDVLVLLRTPGTPDFWIQLAIAALLSVASYLLAPSPRRPPQSQGEDAQGGNTQLAGQTNVLRPGARVPDILGRVRSFPDLLTAPIETWTRRTQQLEQFFCVGRGEYLVTEKKLGETVIDRGIAVFTPGTVLPIIRAVRTAPEVHSISLQTEEGTQTPAQGVDFIGNTMTTIVALDVVVDGFIVVRVTVNGNDGIYKVLAISGGGPYVYTVDRTFNTELDANPLLELFEWRSEFVTAITFNGTTVRRLAGTSTGPGPFPSNGWLCDMQTVTHGTVRGYMRNVTIVETSPRVDQWEIEKIDGTLYNFGAGPFNPNPSALTTVDFLRPLSEGGGGSTPPGPAYGAPTEWYRVPLDELDEVWVDISFPQGLVGYFSGVRGPLDVQVRIDFKRPGAADTQHSATRTYHDSTSGPLRWTERFEVGLLTGLPAGTGIEVRVARLTAIHIDTATAQHISDTRFERLAAMRSLAARMYPDVTIVQLAMTNTRSAVSLGENAFNCIAERVLPSWTPGGGWSAAAPSRRWADNFVARVKALDGANRTDAEIDLVGIYALQASLDALDGGEAGRIALTLDQVQDIDSELAQIADIVRAAVYRVGRKLYVTRDQGSATPLALFNGRAKSSEGETVGVRLKSEDENDAVLVQWVDELSGWKVRELLYADGYPAPILPANVLRVGTLCANWAQAFRRAAYEYKKIKFRRESISVAVTEEGRICRPGDVVLITDDVANLALAAGEVISISGTVLTLDHDLDFTAPGGYTILLRDLGGVLVDPVPCSAVAGSPNKLQLARAPIGITIKGRDEALGTLYAFYNDASVTVRQWRLTSVEASGAFVQLSGVNYSERVYAGDALALPARPPLDID
jgi:hypothetical protein